LTLLTAVNDAQRLLSLPVTATVVADTQETQQLLWGLAKQEAYDLLDRDEYDFPALRRTLTFTASLASLQASGLASDFHRAIGETFWNRSQDRKIYGPLNDVEWGIAFGSAVTSATWQSAMFRNDGLHIYPAPTVADTIAYDYIINTPVQATGGGALKTNFTADNDVYTLGDRVLTLGVVWRYKQSKGRDYAEDMRSYEMALAARYRRDRGAARTLVIGAEDTEWPADALVPDTGFGS
jgi:hypothetical protein